MHCSIIKDLQYNDIHIAIIMWLDFGKHAVPNHTKQYNQLYTPIAWADQRSAALWYNLDISWAASFISCYIPDICGLFIKTRKNKLVKCFNAYGVIKETFCTETAID